MLSQIFSEIWSMALQLIQSMTHNTNATTYEQLQNTYLTFKNIIFQLYFTLTLHCQDHNQPFMLLLMCCTSPQFIRLDHVL